MKPGAAGPVDIAGVVAVQRADVAVHTGGVVEVDVGQAFPAAADSGDGAAHVAGPIGDGLNDG